MEYKLKMAIPAPKLLPQNIEAEQALLGCILIDGQVPLAVFSLIKPEDFYSEIHKTIFDKMLEIYAENKPIDYITLTEKLEAASRLEHVGGIEYLTNLTNIVPSAVNFKYYLDIVKNHARKRNLIYASQQIIEKSYSEEKSRDVLSFAEKQIFDMAEQDDQTSLEHIERGLKEVIKKFDMIAKDKNCLLGIPTGFNKLDEITNGLQNSDLILLAARPGVGKTSLAMNIVDYAAINHKKSCAIFSLEMPTAQLAQRSLCSVACVNMQKALTGGLSDEEWRRLWFANKQLGDAKIYIDDSGLNTPMDILSKCRRLKREKGLDLIMIDYLQLMRSGLRQDNRVLEIAEITRNLKIAAKELNVPIILLSQLSRTVEIRKDHRPMLSDLRDSGAIEQDADIVLFIYNPDMYNDVVNEEGKGICEIEIAKHRNGATGRIKVRWIGEWTSFLDIDSKYHIEKDNVVGTKKLNQENEKVNVQNNETSEENNDNEESLNFVEDTSNYGEEFFDENNFEENNENN